MNSDVFKWSRFRSLCWVELKREGWMPLLVVAIYLILFLLRHPDAFGIFARPKTKEIFDGFFFSFYLSFIVLLSCSRFMFPLADKSLRSGYLMLPVSAMERYFSRLIAVTYPCLLCVLISIEFVESYTELLLYASLGVLGSLFWPKNTIWKLLPILIAVYLIVFIALLLVDPGLTGFFWQRIMWHLSPERAPWILSTVFIPWMNGILAVFCFVISYFRLREMDERMSI